MNCRNLLTYSLLLIAFVCIHCTLKGQDPGKFLIFFKDKEHSEFNILHPEDFLSERAIIRRQNQSIKFNNTDLPVSLYYIDSLKALGVDVVYLSKWLNCVLIESDSNTYKKVKALTFIDSRQEPLKRISQNSVHAFTSYHHTTSQKGGSAITDYSHQLNMIGANVMHNKGNYGQGMLIAVLDAGFINCDKLSIFESLRFRNGIISTYNFTNGRKNVFEGNGHGTQVLSVLAANQPGKLVGSAPGANYILLQTEEITLESRLEEFYWAVGAEYADSAGVDIISSSLGYNTFDNGNTNHNFSELNGTTTMISQAAKQAAAVGMLVCNSAGNEGSTSWHHINVPADAQDVLAIGAVDTEGKYADFSSQGPTADGRVKPDLVALGNPAIIGNIDGSIGNGFGTSFSCPLVAGLAAGLWRDLPGITNLQLIQLLKKSGSNYYTPNNKIGYGIPNYVRAIGIESASPDQKVFMNNMTTEIIFKGDWNYPQAVDLSIFSCDGRKIVYANLNVNSDRFDLQDIANIKPGFYVVRLQANDVTYHFKWIFQ